MKITGVEAIILRQPGVNTAIADGSQDALLVLVHTDEGITGIGEVDSLPLAVKSIIDAPSSHVNASGLAGVLIGEDPLAIDYLWHKMYKRSLYYGRRGAALHAISGIDIALWDIKGKALGLPVHKLLGGPHRTDIRCYASTLMPNTPGEAAELVSNLTGQGFSAIKLGWGPFGQSETLDVQLLAAARKAAGDDVELMMDIGNGWPNALHAIRQVRRFEEYRPYWVEEPLMPDDIDGYAAVVEAVNVPIAAGEEDTTLAGFDDLITRAKVDVIQPDVTRAGGITEMIRIAALASLRGRVMVPHSWSTGIIKAATLQVIGAMPNAVFFEYCVQETALNQQLTVERFPVVDGKTAIPTGPGIGIEIDLEAVQAFRSEA